MLAPRAQTLCRRLACTCGPVLVLFRDASLCACQPTVSFGSRRFAFRSVSVMISCRFALALLCACGSSALHARTAGSDVAKELASAIQNIAAKVALEDGYGEEFASAFAGGGAGVAAGDSAVAFVGIGSDSRSAEWRRMLRAEARATHKILSAELRPFVVAPALAPSFLSMQDLQSVADGAVSAADAFVVASKAAPTSADVASDMARQDAEAVVVSAGGVGAGFLQRADGSAGGAVANVRLVEPSGERTLNAAFALRAGVSDALGALEERQLADEAMYARLSASASS